MVAAISFIAGVLAGALFVFARIVGLRPWPEERRHRSSKRGAREAASWMR
jgi:hypothetical protein